MNTKHLYHNRFSDDGAQKAVGMSGLFKQQGGKRVTIDQAYNRVRVDTTCEKHQASDVKAAIEALESANVNLPIKGRTALHKVICHGHADLVGILLAKGADPNIQDDMDKETALHLVIKAGCFDLVKMLLEAGADPNTKNKSGATPLHLLIKGGHADMIGTLIKAGADPNMPNADGETPLQLAIKGSHFDLLRILLEAGSIPMFGINGDGHPCTTSL